MFFLFADATNADKVNYTYWENERKKELAFAMRVAFTRDSLLKRTRWEKMYC